MEVLRTIWAQENLKIQGDQRSFCLLWVTWNQSGDLRLFLLNLKEERRLHPSKYLSGSKIDTRFRFIINWFEGCTRNPGDKTFCGLFLFLAPLPILISCFLCSVTATRSWEQDDGLTSPWVVYWDVWCWKTQSDATDVLHLPDSPLSLLPLLHRAKKDAKWLCWSIC